jgi:hypothetical protein
VLCGYEKSTILNFAMKLAARVNSKTVLKAKKKILA